MKRFAITIFASMLLCSQLLADTALFDVESSDNPYLEGSNEIGIILLHSRAKHARSHVVEPLRVALNQARGWHTLSLQMPNQDIAFNDYGKFFPEAYYRIQRGIDFLHSKGGQ